VLVDWKSTDQAKFIYLSYLYVTLGIESQQEICTRYDVQLEEIGVAHDLVDQGLDVGVPHAD
jgi:hypothetical protein